MSYQASPQIHIQVLHNNAFTFNSNIRQGKIIQKQVWLLKLPSECSNRGERRFLQYETPRPLIKGSRLNNSSTPYLLTIKQRLNSPIHPLLCMKKSKAPPVYEDLQLPSTRSLSSVVVKPTNIRTDRSCYSFTDEDELLISPSTTSEVHYGYQVLILQRN